MIERIEASLKHLVEPIDSIRSDPANARKHPQRNLQIIQSSLESFGQQKPIVVDAEGVCLAGNGTLQAARALGWTRIAVVRTALRGSEARAYSIVDNRAAETSLWDEQLLAQHLAALSVDPVVDELIIGFDEKQITALIEQISPELPDIEVPQSFSVLVACRDEGQQRLVYEQLTAEGLSCRVLTL